jgi:hypothetical protein
MAIRVFGGVPWMMDGWEIRNPKWAGGRMGTFNVQKCNVRTFMDSSCSPDPRHLPSLENRGEALVTAPTLDERPRRGDPRPRRRYCRPGTGSSQPR